MHVSLLSRLALVAATAGALLGCPRPTSPAPAAAVASSVPAFRYDPADHMMAPPAGAEVLGFDGDLAYVSSSFVAVDGTRLLIRKVSCGRCRRVMGWSFTGEPARMTNDELKELQLRLGLDAAVAPLRSVAAWRGQSMPSLASPR